jgi:hypothetical protein
MVRDISIDPGELPVLPVGSEPESVYRHALVSGLMRTWETKTSCIRASPV